jgi:surface antigen
MRAGRRQLVSVVIALSVLAAGCEYADTHRKTVTGAGVGAVAGAIGGGMYKGSKGALVGAFVGALAGGAIGAYLDHRDKTAAQTYEDYGYEPAAGIQLEVEWAAAEPQIANPGDTVDLKVTYAVMTPGNDDVVRVVETRQVMHNGQKVMEVPHEVLRPGGTFSSTQPLILPDDAGAGTYEVTVTVQGAGQSSSQATTFEVQ